MSKIEDFLTAKQEQAIVNAIKTAEKNTSGEIRVHIENQSEKPPVERAQEVFYQLEMDQTHLKNGILFYLAVSSKQFAIIGDEGIHEKVSNNFWEKVKNKVLEHFSVKRYDEGLIQGILEVGKQLKTYFPHQADDVNELSDEISKGE
ncbi:MAG: TPM domain-containing protein [Lutibacter sp.]